MLCSWFPPKVLRAISCHHRRSKSRFRPEPCSGIMPAASALSPLARLVRQHDRDRFLTALFAPAARRDELLALYAFNYEIAKTREVVSEPVLGQIRLQWWRESLDAIYAGDPVRGHEVATPLAAAIRGRGLTRAHFDALIAAREFDLGGEAPESLAGADLASLARAEYDPFDRRLAGRDTWRSWRLTLAALARRY